MSVLQVNALDLGLNNAVVVMANKVWPLGWDVGPNAPSSFKALCEEINTRRRVTVYDGGCECTIFDQPEVNYAMRAWHDWCHWRYGYDFSLRGETMACEKQIEQLFKVYGRGDQTERWARILWAEVVGQREYYERHRKYVEDQMSFVKMYLLCPASALMMNWDLPKKAA